MLVLLQRLSTRLFQTSPVPFFDCFVCIDGSQKQKKGTYAYIHLYQSYSTLVVVLPAGSQNACHRLHRRLSNPPLPTRVLRLNLTELTPKICGTLGTNMVERVRTDGMQTEACDDAG